MSHSKWSRRRVIKGALAAGVAIPAILHVRSALAAYPERPIRFVVANTPGGPSDITARILTAALEQSTGKTFIVENRGGAGGNIGMGYAAGAEPDGYTILLATNAYSVNYALYNKLPYDPYKDFVGVCELASSPNTFVVRSETAGQDHQGIRRAREGQSGEIQRRDPAGRNCAAHPGRGAEGAREHAEARDHRLQGRRRRAAGVA